MKQRRELRQIESDVAEINRKAIEIELAQLESFAHGVKSSRDPVLDEIENGRGDVAMSFSNPANPAECCLRCRVELAETRQRGSITPSSNITDADDRQRAVNQSHAAARCAMRLVPVE